MKQLRLVPLKFLLLLTLVFSLSSFAQAETSMDVEKAISSGDHKGLAEYYKSQAEAQRKTVEMHKNMKKTYTGQHAHYKGYENVLAGHCGNLQFQAAKMADQYDALAQEEEKLAAKKVK